MLQSLAYLCLYVLILLGPSKIRYALQFDRMVDHEWTFFSQFTSDRDTQDRQWLLVE